MPEIVVTILQSSEFAAFVFASLTAIATWLARSTVRLIRSKLNEEQLKVLFRVSEQAVRVVEQTAKNAGSAEKKAKAIEVAQTYLDAYGIKVSAAQLDAAIEAAVFSVITQFEAPVPEPVIPPAEG